MFSGNSLHIIRLYLAHLVEDAAIIRVESPLIEEQAFLHCARGFSAPIQYLSPVSKSTGGQLRTPLEAANGRRDLHAAGEEVWQCGKCYGEEDAEGCRGGEEGGLCVGAVDVCERFHPDVSLGIIVVSPSSSYTPPKERPQPSTSNSIAHLRHVAAPSLKSKIEMDAKISR